MTHLASRVRPLKDRTRRGCPGSTLQNSGTTSVRSMLMIVQSILFRAELGLRTAKHRLAMIQEKHSDATPPSLSPARSRANLGHSIKRTRRSRTQHLGLEIVNLGLLLPPSTRLPSSCSIACSTCHNTRENRRRVPHKKTKKRSDFADW